MTYPYRPINPENPNTSVNRAKQAELGQQLSEGTTGYLIAGIAGMAVASVLSLYLLGGCSDTKIYTPNNTVPPVTAEYNGAK